ncbi:hypothetical protein IJ843_06010 [bacterium]|nr:hypothetical protein [bacterium]
MGIIGVVAALTLPNLNSSTGNKEKVVHLMKVYSNLNDALDRAQAVYGPIGTWIINDSSNTDKVKRIGGRLTEFLKVRKNCESVSNHASCTGYASLSSEYYSFILADGAVVYFYSYNSFKNLSLSVGIDGPKQYTWEKGPFLFSIDLDTGILTPGGQNYSNCLSYGNNGNCTAWVIDNGNMDYLKCLSKLSATNTTCK